MDTSAIPEQNIDPMLGSIWQLVFDRVRSDLQNPTVWLAMQEVKPVALQDNHFIAGLSKQMYYLAMHLQTHEATQAIEDALREVSGRPLVFDLFEGATLAQWEQHQQLSAAPPEALKTVGGMTPRPAATVPSPPPPPPAVPQAPKPTAYTSPVTQTGHTREVSQSWEKVSERIALGYKHAPLIKYPHGQARFVLECVVWISDTMDLLMPNSPRESDPTQERGLSRVIERMAASVTLDAMFISLELW